MTDLAAFLAHHGIDAQRFDHPPVMTVEESERLVPKLPGAKTKNLFLRNKKGDRHFLVTVPHDLVVDLNALGARLGAGRLGFASAERLQRHLGITPGSVSLLALVNDTAHAVEFVIERGDDRQQRAVHALEPADLHVGHDCFGQHGRQRGQRVGGGQRVGVGVPPPAVRLERQLQPVHEPARACHGRARERIIQRDDLVFARQQHVAERHGSIRSVDGADLHGHEHSGRRRELPVVRRDVATATSDRHPGAAPALRTSRAAPSP